MEELFSQFPLWVKSWIIFPLLIILARMCDVSLGTVRIILIAKGYKNIAPVIGFVEVLIWLVVVSQIMQNLDKVQYYFAFALGFALGTFIGIKIENRLSLGQVMVQVITNHDVTEFVNNLKQFNSNFTVIDAAGKFGPVKIILIIAQRHLLRETIKVIETSNRNFFYFIQDIRQVIGTLPGRKNPILYSLNPFQKKI